MLFQAHKFFAFLQAIRLTLDVDHGTMVQNPIQGGRGNRNVGEDLIPLGEGLVGVEDGGSFLIPPGNELEEQVCALGIHREIANFVDDEHPVLGQNLELIRQTVLKVGLLELFNELVAVDAAGGEAVLCCHQAQGGGQMGLAHTGRAYILPVLQEAHGSKLVDLALVDGGLEGKVKVVQSLLDGKTDI